MKQTPEQREKRLAYMKAWRAANRERFLAAQKRWRDDHREHKHHHDAAYRAGHRDEISAQRKGYREVNSARLAQERRASRPRRRAATRRWAQRHPEKIRAMKVNQFARRRGSDGDVTARQWKEILLFYGNACAQCRVSASVRPLSVDHYIPLAAGGVHDWTNVWPLCVPCNSTKHTKVPTGAPPHVAALSSTAVHLQGGSAC